MTIPHAPLPVAPPRRHRVAAAVAALLGVATIVAGSRVLLGGDPGYEVVRPVLVFNTVMGGVYLAAAVAMLRFPARARALAWFIAEANAVVLAGVLVMRFLHAPVATQTLVTMGFRTVAWAGIVIALRGGSSSRGRVQRTLT